MVTQDNPAGRLYEVFNSLLEMRPETPIGTVWASYFALESENTKEIYAQLIELMNLVDRAKKDIQQQFEGMDHAHYLEPLENIERVLNHPNLTHPWKSISQHLDRTTINGLRFCSDVLSQRIGEKVISDEDLSRLQMEVETLVEKVLMANLPEELTAVLTQKLEEIRQAIVAYRITGNEGLRRALGGSIGEMRLYMTQMDKLEDDKQGRIILEIFEFMAHVAQILGFVVQVTQLAGPLIVPLLGSGGS